MPLSRVFTCGFIASRTLVGKAYSLTGEATSERDFRCQCLQCTGKPTSNDSLIDPIRAVG